MCYHLFVESKNIIQMNLFINTKQYRLTNIENKFMITKEIVEVGDGNDKLEVCN